jgi:hypothetical protein
MKIRIFPLWCFIMSGCLLLLAVGCKKSPEAGKPNSVPVQQNPPAIPQPVREAPQPSPPVTRQPVQVTPQPPPPQIPSFPADALVAQLFQALKDNDFAAIYKMDYKVQDQVARIRQTSAQFILEKELQKYYDYNKNFFENGGSYYSILPFVRLNPETKIIELRNGTNPYNSGELVHEVYVSLKFKADAMPDALMEDGTRGKLKETVCKLVFTGSGLYIDSDVCIVHDANVVIPAP